MTDSKLIDSSMWIDYLFNGKHSEIIDSSELLLLSALSIFEIKNKLKKSKVDDNKIERSIEFIKKRSLVIEVNIEIAEKAVDFSIRNNLAIIDSLIYTTAILNKSELITLDNDFRGLDKVRVLDVNP